MDATSQNQENVLPHGVTQAQIEEWKKKHKDVYLIKVKDEQGNTKSCYLRRPDRKVLDAAYKAMQKGSISKFNETILNNCWLAGDEEIKTDEYLFGGVAEKLGDIIEFAESEVKKL
jgi:hypothetical protein